MESVSQFGQSVQSGQSFAQSVSQSSQSSAAQFGQSIQLVQSVSQSYLSARQSVQSVRLSVWLVSQWSQSVSTVSQCSQASPLHSQSVRQCPIYRKLQLPIDRARRQILPISFINLRTTNDTPNDQNRDNTNHHHHHC